MPWTLSATGSPSASALVVATATAVPGATSPMCFFLIEGKPQVGALDVHAASNTAMRGPLVTEHALATPLTSPFPSAMILSAHKDALLVVDSPFGPGSVVRSFPFSSWSSNKLTEDVGRRFSAATEDLDGDGKLDTPVLGRIVLDASGTYGIVSYTILGNSVPGAAGGAYVYELSSGTKLGRVLVPNVSTASTTVGYVADVAVDGDTLAIAVAEKGPMFSDVLGQVSIYHVSSWKPFAVTPGVGRFDVPSAVVRTSTPAPVAVTLVAHDLLVVDAPFFQNGTLDVMSLPSASIASSLPLGPLFTAGNFEPGPVRLSPDGSVGLLGSEAGMLRFGITKQ
jgi:hypothetical protein